MLRHRACAFIFTASLLLLTVPAFAQLPDATTLTGNYNVRYLGVFVDTNTGADVPLSFSGTFTFDGKGGFTVTGQGASASGKLTFAPSGKYMVLSNGMVSLTNIFDSNTTTPSNLYGGVGSNGVVFASATESLFIDTLVAIPQAKTSTNATLTGNYNVASLEFLGGSVAASRQTFFPMTADGSGSLGNVTVQGTAPGLNGTWTSQTSPGATYSLTGTGTGTLTLPAPSGVTAANVLLSGAKVLAVSPDGSFFIAGSQTGYDMVIGLKALPSTDKTQMNGNYFTGYLDSYLPGQQNGGVYATEGAANELSQAGNVEIIHQRINCDVCYAAYDQVYDDNFAFNTGGTAVYQGSSAWALGPNGDMAIGAGQNGSDYFIELYVRAPAMNGTGVFLNPQGIVNSASYAPFTAQYSPGEFVTLFGTGLAAGTAQASALPFPTTLGNVQVLVNGNPAPVYYVSAGQISAVIPDTAKADANGLISFQVVNNNQKSNTVQVFLGASSPGVFTQQSNGISDGAITHADGSLVTKDSPAKAGETVVIYMTGLGPVSPTVTAGTAAPSNPLAQITNQVEVNFIDSQGNSFAGTVQFAGLTPTAANLYQINVAIPAGISTGSLVVDVTTEYVIDAAGDIWADVDNSMATIQVGK